MEHFIRRPVLYQFSLDSLGSIENLAFRNEESGGCGALWQQDLNLCAKTTFL